MEVDAKSNDTSDLGASSLMKSCVNKEHSSMHEKGKKESH